MDRRKVRKKAVKKVNMFLASLMSEDTEGTETVMEDYHAISDTSVDQAYPFYPSQSESEGETSGEFEDDYAGGDMDSLSLVGALSDWAVRFGVSLVALSALLGILRIHHPYLPKDARTLLKTKTLYSVQNVAGGHYYYFGILNSFGRTMERMWSKVTERHVFSLQLNFDGLPLFKNSSVQFWPILGMLRGCMKKPVVIALFCGTSKPNSLCDYLSDLVHELQELSKGFLISGKHLFLTVSSVICDAPARAYIKGIKFHTGYSGCDKCIQEGVYVNHRMIFPELNSPRRTDSSFISLSDEGHHVQSSPLKEASIGMVSCFPHDYMHLVCLGVMRKLLDLWLAVGPLCCRATSHQSELISSSLISMKDYIPVDFARKPRRLSERLRWKATELRQFLLYTGPVVLSDVLSLPVYKNFMLLSVAIFILSSPVLSQALNDFAHHLLVSFVEHFSQLYGPEHVVYNVHGLTHLSEDVKLHGNLDLISGFPYENYLGQIKKMIRTPHHPLSQVIRRISEINSCPTDDELAHGKQMLKKEHKDGPIPSSFQFHQVRQFKEVVLDDTTLNVSKHGDNFVKIDDCISLVVNILQSQGKVYVVFKEYQEKKSFYEYPINSCELGIYVVDNLSLTLKTAELNVEKYVRLPYKGKFVAVPLLHFSRWNSGNN